MIAHDPYWGPALTFKDTTITFALIGYAFVSALLPVWLILAPRDYLATFLKIGVIVGLALGIVVLNPELKMPAYLLRWRDCSRSVLGSGTDL